MFLLGYDVGSSSVKASLVDAQSGQCVASAYYPKNEAPIASPKPGWAEQDPDAWWSYLKSATQDIMQGKKPADIAAIGISYQMHGLVCVDKDLKPLRPSIIWCDSRAVQYGKRAMETIGEEKCLGHLLNSPGNFTAAKLAWVKENEPELYGRIYKFMLPGDYIALKLSGEACTTVSGLSEGIFWDFKEKCPADFLFSHFGFDKGLMPEIKPTFGLQGEVSAAAAEELGLRKGIPITYRAGDQPNNALSLNVLEPGEIASTAGTSGVVYGVLDSITYDPKSRVNTFAHVNHTADKTRLGVLLCINGVGILNSWTRHNFMPEGMTYREMDEIAERIPIGSEGISVLPFGNGVERMLGNRETGCCISGLDLKRHNWRHMTRAVQEGIVFSFKYGMDIMKGMGIAIRRIHAGDVNMFKSQVFREALAGVTDAAIDLYDTDGSIGAAKGAGIGAGIYKSPYEAFSTLKKKCTVEPSRGTEYAAAYKRWRAELQKQLQQ